MSNKKVIMKKKTSPYVMKGHLSTYLKGYIIIW